MGEAQVNLSLLISTAEVRQCQACPRRKGCTAPVIERVSPVPVLCVSLAPDAEDDSAGLPMVGRKGDMLNKLLQEAGLRRFQQVGCTTFVKCHGQEPTPEERAACKGWLWKELKQQQPRVVVPFGKTVTAILLKRKPGEFKLEEVAGTFQEVPYMAAVVAPWYEPSYLLKRGKKGWQQSVNFFKSIKERLGVD